VSVRLKDRSVQTRQYSSVPHETLAPFQDGGWLIMTVIFGLPITERRVVHSTFPCCRSETFLRDLILKAQMHRDCIWEQECNGERAARRAQRRIHPKWQRLPTIDTRVALSTQAR